MSFELQIFSGNAHPQLARKIANQAGKSLSALMVSRYADGETRVQILTNVRGNDCFVIQPTCPPVNDNLMELLIIIDALRRASARRITAVMPYYGYARQDRKAEPRVPITAKLVANLLTAAGANRILTVDLHAGQIQGFFDIPVDHLYANPVFLDYFRRQNYKNLVVVSPDAGGVERCRAFAKRLDCDLAIVDKRRTRPNESSVMNIIGPVGNRTALILDDLVDTAGTLTKVARAIKEKGARRILAAATHGVFSGEAIKLLENSPIEEMIVSDSIPAPATSSAKIRRLSIASLLSQAIVNIHRDKSVSRLFV